MTHVEQLSKFVAEVQAYCAEEGIAPSTLTNQVLGQTYALPRMMSAAGSLDSREERLRDAMSDRPRERPFITPAAQVDAGLRRSMSFDLPVPPSTNNLFATVKQMAKGTGAPTGKNIRIPARAYEVWKGEAGREILVQRAGLAKKALPSNQPFVTRIRIAAGDPADTSNRIKALEDLLVDMGITPDDRYQLHVSCGRSAQVKPGRVFITVRSVPIKNASIDPS